MIYFVNCLSMTKKEHNLLINVDELTWWFGDTPELLFNKFSFALYKWDFTILMWKSGSGKTVFSKFLTRKIKSAKDTIYYKMKDISTYTDDEVQLYRRKLWLVFQDYKLIDYMTVKENIIYPLKIYGMWEATIEAKYNRIRKELNIIPFEDRPVKKLSGGEKQFVNIARAIIHDPELIIADEPTGNLDRDNTQKVADVLMRLNKEWKTVLLFTHDIHLLNYLKKNTEINLFKL